MEKENRDLQDALTKEKAKVCNQNAELQKMLEPVPQDENGSSCLEELKTCNSFQPPHLKESICNSFQPLHLKESTLQDENSSSCLEELKACNSFRPLHLKESILPDEHSSTCNSFRPPRLKELVLQDKNSSYLEELKTRNSF